MDKVAAKHEMRAAELPTPDWAAFNATAFRELGAADTLEEIEERLGFPLVVKPASQGSSLGVEFASSRDEVPQALLAAFSYDDRVLLERYVKGRELAVSVLGGEALPSSRRSRARRTSSTSRRATRSGAPSTSAPPIWRRGNPAGPGAGDAGPTRRSAAAASPGST